MKKIYSVIFLSILITSCSPRIRYIGQTHRPTKTIDVFVTEGSIKRPYEFIGKGYLGGFTYKVNPSKVQKKAEELGREKGADAVLILDYYIPDTGGTNIYSHSQTDTTARGVVTNRHTSIQPVSQSGYQIMYLKYTP